MIVFKLSPCCVREYSTLGGTSGYTVLLIIFTCSSSQHDDMSVIYEAIKKADAVIIGSPIYMRQVTGQTKTFFDRLFPMAQLTDAGFQPRFGTKKTVMVYSQGNPDPNAYAAAFADNAGVMKSGGFDVVDTIVAAGDAVPKAEAFAAGKNLVLQDN